MKEAMQAGKAAPTPSTVRLVGASPKVAQHDFKEGFYHFLRTHIISFPVKAFFFAQFHPITCSYIPQSSETTHDPPVVWASFILLQLWPNIFAVKKSKHIHFFKSFHFLVSLPKPGSLWEASPGGPSLIRSAQREQDLCRHLLSSSSPGPIFPNCPGTSNCPGALEGQISRTTLSPSELGPEYGGNTLQA